MSKTKVDSEIVNESIKPPLAKKIRKELVIHNHVRIDNYYWLNQRDNPEVIEYLNAENNYTAERMKGTEKLQKKLYNEITGRMKPEDSSVPYEDKGFFYYSRYEGGKEYPIYCRKKENLDAEEEIMLNVNEMAKGFSFFNVVGISISPDNKLIAFGVDSLSRRIYDIHFKDLTTGAMLPDKIKNTTGRVEWANNNKTIYYSTKDKTLRPYKIFKHNLGSSQNDDVEIFHEKDETFGVYISKTKSGKYLLIESYSTVSTEFRFLDADEPEGEFKVIQSRERNLEYSVYHLNDKFMIRTNLGAKNFRLMETSINETNKEHWNEIIPHRDNVFLEDVEVFNDYLCLQERENGVTKLRVINKNDESEHYINFDEETIVTYISTNKKINSKKLRYYYSSLTTPSSTYDYDMETKEKLLLKQEEVLGDFDSKNYKSERLYATAKDGAKIPISLVYKKGVVHNGDNPLLLYGYGSYGISTDPYFNSVRLSLLNRGFVFAIAHIRGGQELGRKWYEDGKLLKKKNSFTDFITCAEYLMDENYTNRNKLFALGGSAGGLLMGAVLNMRPDLFRGVVAAVPFVDVVTTMLDDSIPLTTGEFDEWGNPNLKKYYDYILSYSPYDNVEAKEYPAILVTTGLHDSQVQYWEPAKWVAKLREMKTDNNLLLLHTDMDSGHSGASGRFEKYKDTVLEYTFMLNLLGISE